MPRQRPEAAPGQRGVAGVEGRGLTSRPQSGTQANPAQAAARGQTLCPAGPPACPLDPPPPALNSWRAKMADLFSSK